MEKVCDNDNAVSRVRSNGGGSARGGPLGHWATGSNGLGSGPNLQFWRADGGQVGFARKVRLHCSRGVVLQPDVPDRRVRARAGQLGRV